MQSELRVTVIIPTLQKRISVLNELIDVLVKDETVKELILIDNSRKGFISKHEKVRVIIPRKNLYVNPSWNFGVQETKTEYFALINDDLLVCENFCSKVLDLIKDKEDFGIMGMETTSVTDTKDITLPQITNFNLMKEPDNAERQHNWGVIIFGRKSRYYKIPENIKILCGDDYLRFIAQKHNYNIYNLSGANVKHLGATSSGLKKFLKIGYIDIINYSKIDPKMEETCFYQMAKKELSPWKFLQNIFSIKNSDDKKHKIITILGIKISFKKREILYNNFGENIFSIKNRKTQRKR